MPRGFHWSPTCPLPGIEDHSLRKLDVLRKYLDVYFDTVSQDPRMDSLNITLVDGFCGGGAYRRGGAVEHGSPIILLKAVEEARTRLNAGRRKPLGLNARFVFIDKNREHIASLGDQIRQAGFGDRIGGAVFLKTGEFIEELPGILEGIRRGQRAGRSIFVLDQCGYKDVPMDAVRSIFETLDRPEVLMTFAIDALLNYLREDSAEIELYRQFGIDGDFIAEWSANKSDDALGRLVTQRILMTGIHRSSGASFFTPFMLRSPTDHRWMMIAHLSRHQAARDKMLGVHWDSQNYFRHVGRGSLFTLGFDKRLIESKDSLFDFGARDRASMKEELLEELPREIGKLAKDGPLPVETLLKRIGNRTAAANRDILDSIGTLAGYREVIVRSQKGARKRGSRVLMRDQLVMPAQRPFFWSPSRLAGG